MGKLPGWFVHLAACSIALAAGCGGTDFSSTADASTDGPGSGGTAGSGASAGSGGSAGSSGSAGSGGSAGVSSGGTGGVGASGGTAGSSGSGAAGTDGGIESGTDAGTCDPAEQPTAGVFVSPTGSTSGDGTPALPFSTIAAGLDAAASSGATTVYLDQGTYPEPVDFKANHAGITLRGGFARTGGVWTRDCTPDARAKTVIASPAAVGVHVGQLSKPAGLETLSVFTKAHGTSAAGKSGESCYGVAITGAGTNFSLVEVAVTAGAGGSGGPASAIVSAPDVVCGDPTSACEDGADGSVGVPGAATAPGAFNAGGWLAGDGVAGQPGGQGHSGTPGAVGASATCYYSGCSGGGGQCSGLFCGSLGTHGVTAGHGTCGCGGKGGNAGGAGLGGGASVALFVSGAGAQVNIVQSTLVAKKGGDGSAGVDGASGSVGGQGAPGAPASCPGNCQSVDKGGGTCNCEQPSSYNLSGGAAGGVGGSGGPGGSGTGGSGGPSYAVVRVGGSVVALDATSSRVSDQGGQGANAPDGGSGDDLAVP